MPSFKSLLFLAAVAAAEIHTVEVGDDQSLKFSPANITAQVGDTVIFKLYPQHNVAQGAFESPCAPSDGGIYSGPFANTDGGKKKFVINVTTTDPIYYYCAVPTHCQKGMVGGINIPTGDKDLAAYAAAASKVGSSSAPSGLSGGKLLDDAEIASLTASVTSSASGTASPTSAPPASSTASVTGASNTPTGAASAAKVNLGVAAVVGAVAWAL
ncbi:hypothetical protein K505DRAFT_237680 [Melanomma pulvis-pyrius CBS 109.77]|uniref:Blue (type 1) copper domain-containing protein n=1 Tax=Melanomma pulvis-pyrius CBS 109.77 TaxID=1314802 RepID=A0A6A6XJ08_9PLEO|nr:hypothetical protein K505DRAFT_237680 [Melanomma pulvis-pyrius CBS 109.77]